MMCTRAALRRLLIATPGILAGCASVMGPGVTPQVRTVASVGDKPLPLISGPPGDTVVAANEAPEVKARPDGRVSGRVFDESGRPVPNAQVRLAVGGAERGRAVNTVSDESGAFTLRGLRRGVSYTVVVESEDGREVRSGRAEVQAPEHDVRIALAADPADAGPGDTPRRVGRVSSRRAESPGEEGEEPAPRVNHEDLPPAEEAGSGRDDLEAPPAGEPAPARPKGHSRTAPSPSGWHRPGGTGDREASQATTTEPDLQDSGDLPASQASQDPEPRPRDTPTPGEGSDEPLAEVPVPDSASAREPAREAPRLGASVAATDRPADEASPGELPLDEDRKPSGAPAAAGLSAARTEAPKADEPAAQADPIPDLIDPAPAAGPSPAAARTGVKEAAVATVETSPKPGDPMLPADPPADSPGPSATEAGADPMPSTSDEPAAKAPEAGQAGAKPAESAVTEEKAADAATSHRRTTWGELRPPVAGVQVAAAEPRKSFLGRRSRGPAKLGVEAAAGVEAVAAECKVDGRRNQVIDFRLPDVAGRPVRFKDLDADLVLLDFWGTWCPPCVQSVPHLVALQEKMGAGRLKVVGIAYEKADSAPERAASVTAAASKLGINYQVLMGDADTCPLQAALHVQAYPTMVLLDREGHILWRDQGSSPGTLARLDKVIDAQAGAVVARR